jgi:hypothetical protein
MDTTAPDPTIPETPEAAPGPIDPLMGFDTFAQMSSLSPALTAAFTRWLLVTKHDPNRYYAHTTWQDFLAQARQHPTH